MGQGAKPHIILCCLALLAGPALAQVVALSADDQSRLGIHVSKLAAAERQTQVAAFAKVLDPGPLAQLCSDLFAAEAAAAASGAEARRLTALHAEEANIAAKDMEAAVAQAKADQSRLMLLRQRLGLEWGSGVSRLSEARLRALAKLLSQGGAALVHVDTPSNEGQAGARTVDIDVGDESLKGIVLGPARTAEPRLSSSGLLVEVTGKSSVLLSVGLTQSAHIDTSKHLKGVLVPRNAVVRYRGESWAYVQYGQGRFRRVLLQNIVPEDAGLFVSSGVSPNDQIVSEGSSALFAVEQNGAPAH